MSSKMFNTAQDKAYAYLKEGLVNLQLKPGQELRTADLALKIGVSRTPVREALSRLEQEGLVRRNSGWGYVVRPMTLKEIFDLFKVRESLEVLAATEAAQNVTKAQLREMATALKRSERLLGQDELGKFRAASREFHMLITVAAGNSLLHQVMLMINDRVRQLAAMQLSVRTGRAREMLRENHQLLQALIEGNASAARAAVVTKMRNAKKEFLRFADSGRSDLP